MATSGFGTQFGERMALAHFHDGAWRPAEMAPTDAVGLHPASHVLHYASACFEGLKAHRGTDGRVRVFRLDAHVERMRRSAWGACLPVPAADALAAMILDTVRANLERVPTAPGSLYLRPTLIGTDRNIGAAGTPSATAMLFVLSSPVGEYFGRDLKVVVETRRPRTAPQFGRLKAGANYALALPVLQEARDEHGADQVLFAHGGRVQETGASNVVLLAPGRLVTPPLGEDFLHGITRDSVVRLAEDLGDRVEERDVDVNELMSWMASDGEIALTGTAAVLSPVGEIVHPPTGRVARSAQRSCTERLRDALRSVQNGAAADPHGWVTEVAPG